LAAAPRAKVLFRNAEKLSEDGFRQLEIIAEALRREEEKKAKPR